MADRPIDEAAERKAFEAWYRSTAEIPDNHKLIETERVFLAWKGWLARARQCEGWRQVVGYEGFYEVSDRGNVRSVTRIIPHNKGPKRTIVGTIIVGQIDTNGYVVVGLKKGWRARKKMHRVHRLVAEAFLPNPEMKPSVNHKDSDRSHNILDNLEWCTLTENMQHASAAGRMRAGNCCLSDDEAAAIRRIYATGSATCWDIAVQYSVNETVIKKIVNGKNYRRASAGYVKP